MPAARPVNMATFNRLANLGHHPALGHHLGFERIALSFAPEQHRSAAALARITPA